MAVEMQQVEAAVRPHRIIGESLGEDVKIHIFRNSVSSCNQGLS